MTHRDHCVHGPTPDLTGTDLTVRLGDRLVLDEVQVHAAGGRVTGLLGPNGSGKTTLLHVLAGLRRPDRGVVLVGDVAVRSLSHRRRARTIALVEQHASTTTDLSVRQVVALGQDPPPADAGRPGQRPGCRCGRGDPGAGGTHRPGRPGMDHPVGR